MAKWHWAFKNWPLQHKNSNFTYCNKKKVLCLKYPQHDFIYFHWKWKYIILLIKSTKMLKAHGIWTLSWIMYTKTKEHLVFNQTCLYSLCLQHWFHFKSNHIWINGKNSITNLILEFELILANCGFKKKKSNCFVV